MIRLTRAQAFPSRPATFGILAIAGVLITALASPAASWAEEAQKAPGEPPASAADPLPGAADAAPQQPEGGTARGWTIGVRGLYATFAEDQLGSAPGVTAFGIYDLATDLELELEAGLARSSSDTGTLPAGDLTLVPIRATLRVQIWRFRSALPYVGGGAGFYLTDFSLDDATRTDLEQLGFMVQQDIDSTVGVHVAAGVEWERGRWKFGVDAKYQAVSADSSSRIVDTVSGLVFTDSAEVDLNGLWLAFGARFRFR